MKLLKILILADMVFLMILGFGMFLHLQFSPADYPGSLLALGLVGSMPAAMVLATIALALVGDHRRLAMWLSYANALVTAMVFIQQQVVWGSALGWILVLTCLLMTVGLAWAAQRPLKPGEREAELVLRIPKEIRQDVLRQISEAAAQEERNRLARDLHDSIKQQLFSINVGTATAQERWERDPDGARAVLADVRRSAKEAMVEMQALLHQLRPEALSSVKGLIEALREQCEALGYRSGSQVTVELGEEIPDDRLRSGALEALFRIAQEALANVARHARAQRVRVWLGREGESALLRVEDDGQGFDPETANPGMGLHNLRERAESVRGILEIASAPAAGTRLSVRIPLAPPPVPAETAKAQGAEVWIILQQMALMTCLLLLKRAPPIWFGLHLFVLLVALLLTGLLFWAWITLQDQSDKGSSQTALPLSFLFGWFLASDFDFKSLWWWGLCFCYVFFIGGRGVLFYQATRFRRFWRKGARIWLGLILLAETGTLLALWLAFFPGVLTLNPAEAVYVALMGLSVLYIASREPRSEGASA